MEAATVHWGYIGIMEIAELSILFAGWAGQPKALDPKPCRVLVVYWSRAVSG